MDATRSKVTIELSLALALGLLAIPVPVYAHEGGGFHPERLWALLRTTLLVAVVGSALLGVLWLYQRQRSRPVK